MFLAAVMDPAILGQQCCKEKGYVKDLLHILEGIDSNGLLLLDPHKKLAREMVRLAEGMVGRPELDRAREIIEEWIKPHLNSRVVPRHIPIATCPDEMIAERQNRDLLDLGIEVRKKARGDVLLSPDANASILKRLGESDFHVPPENYGMSDQESERQKWKKGLEPSQLTIESLDILITRTVRHASEVRIFDKMIGESKDMEKWAIGIQYVLDVWKREGLYPAAKCLVHIITCCEKTYGPDRKDVYEKMKGLKARLSFPGDIHLHLKLPQNGSEFHARFLQAGSAVLRLDRGVDFFTSGKKRRLIRQFVNVDRAFGHLERYFSLPEYKPEGDE